MPETTDNYHRIPVEDILESDDVITKTLSAAEGIKALYSTNRKLILTYLFDTSKWTMAKARAWVRDHSKGMVDVAESTAPNAGLEFKELNCEYKVNQSEGIVEGWISTKDADLVGDVMEPAGCDMSQYTGIVLFNHDPNQPLGRHKDMRVDPARGVWTQWQRSKKSARAAEVVDMIEEGIITRNSFAFKALAWDYDRKDKGGRRVRHVTKWPVFEYGPTSLAVNQAAEITAVKSMLSADAQKSLIDQIAQRVLAEVSPGAAISPNGETGPESETPDKKSYPFDFDTEADRIIDVVKLFGLFPEETKAGRKISGARLTRLKEAVQTLAEIILEAEPASAADVEGAAEEVAEAAGKSAALSPENYDAFVKMIAAQLRAA